MTNKPKEEYNPDILPDLLPLYYKRLFPHKPFYRWLSYGESDSSIFRNREFSFTLQDDIYIRYLSFEEQFELEKEIYAKNPHKIDIGPVMTTRPKDHRFVMQMKPIQRELVFDIDMTDYDPVRTCCKGADVCLKCWKFMTIACKVLDAALREDFGFEHILWVFSGRRGIHCWVCDSVARMLDTKGRTAVAEYLSLVVSGGEGTVSKVSLPERYHHSVRRALQIIEPMFEEIILVDQNLFGTEQGVANLVQMIPDEMVRKELAPKLSAFPGDSKAVWKTFTKHFYTMRVHGGLQKKMKNIVEEVQLALAYPRLDINVTKGFNHLLKSPFCIHPKTGKVCVPFNPSAASKFDPTSVPTISLLVEEINAFDEKNITEEDAGKEDKSKIKDHKKTSMFKGVLVFEEFLRRLETSIKKQHANKLDF